jgi:hypothetical protein
MHRSKASPDANTRQALATQCGSTLRYVGDAYLLRLLETLTLYGPVGVGAQLTVCAEKPGALGFVAHEVLPFCS